MTTGDVIVQRQYPLAGGPADRDAYHAQPKQFSFKIFYTSDEANRFWVTTPRSGEIPVTRQGMHVVLLQYNNSAFEFSIGTRSDGGMLRGELEAPDLPDGTYLIDRQSGRLTSRARWNPKDFVQRNTGECQRVQNEPKPKL